MTNIYVGNLSFQTTEDELRILFSAYGEVLSSRIIQDRDSGRSKGFGFVEMNDEDAPNAIESLDQKDFGGRKVKVNKAMEREARGGGGGGDFRRRGPGGNGGGYGGGGNRGGGGGNRRGGFSNM